MLKKKYNEYSLLLIFVIFLQTACYKENLEVSKVKLGKALFSDTRLSVNNTKSCASCHNPQFAFSDGYRTSATALGEQTLHNAPSLINVSKYKVYNWASPSINSLESQMLRPLFSNTPVEMGANLHWESIQKILRTDILYKKLIEDGFPQNNISTKDIIIQSISAYLKTLNSLNAPFDKFLAGDKEILSTSAQNGYRLFMSTKLKCSTCHPPPYFTKASFTAHTFENTGLTNPFNQTAYSKGDSGLALHSKKGSDFGKFRIPSLRNVWLTKPYMHNGSVQTLSEVIELYANGGKEISNIPKDKVGNRIYTKSHLIKGFSITDAEKTDLLNFLISLTDSTVLTKF